MSDLIVIGYPDETTAQRVWAKLTKLEHDYLVDLDDAAIISRDRKGKLRVTTPRPSRGAVGSAERAVLGRTGRLAVPVPARPAGRRRNRHSGRGAWRGRRPRGQGRLHATSAGPGAARNLSHPGHRAEGDSGQVPGGLLIMGADHGPGHHEGERPRRYLAPASSIRLMLAIPRSGGRAQRDLSQLYVDPKSCARDLGTKSAGA